MQFLNHVINNNIPTYGNSSPPNIEAASSIKNGNSANTLNISFQNHIGTHIDLPKHFDDDGATLNDFKAADWVFTKIQLLDIKMSNEEMLSINHLKDKINPDTEVILIKTGFEQYRNEKRYWNNNPGVLPETGAWLRENFPNVNIIGFDFISLSCYQKRDIGRAAHKAFLNSKLSGKPILIIEDMKLDKLQNDPSKLIVAPLMIDGADGVPVTVVAFA